MLTPTCDARILLFPDDDLHSGNGRDDAAKCCVYLWALGETVLFDDGENTLQGTRKSFVTGDWATAGSRAIGRVRARSWEPARVEALAPHEHSDEELAREERQRWWGRF